MNAPLKDREAALMGMGDSRLRKEDARFIQGKGNYVDDIKLPNMVYMDIVRSPLAHARIKKINKEDALKIPGVIAVLTAEDLKPLKLHWMPTLAGDVAAVLADEKVHFQMQEVAVVLAETRYAAADGKEAVQVEYEELPVVINPFDALKDDAPILREDLVEKMEGAHGTRHHPNDIFTWQAGDAAAADAAFASAEVVVKEDLLYPRVHPCPLETCGCVASFDPIRGDLTTYITSQAPHVVRTVVSMLSGIPESKVRIISPDIGGGFGNKVGIYPGYVCAIVSSIVLGRPVKWIEDRIENLSSTAFARDYHMTGELAATADGKIQGLRVNVLADHGAFDACADPTKFPAGLFHICSGSYDIPAAHCTVRGVYTNKAPGGVAYRCSFRVTEAVYLIERMVDVLAQKLNMDKSEIRKKNFIRKEQFPYKSAFGFEYDSGDYHTALDQVLNAVDYKGLRAEQAAKRADPNSKTLMGIGLVTFTEIVGAGPSKICDILGIGMFDSCEIRVDPTGSAIARMGTISQGQGHQTTYAQIIATELGIASDVIKVEEGDTDTAPYGLGTYGSRSTPVAGAAIAMAARKIHAKAKKIAASLLEVSENDLEWEVDRFKVRGNDDKFKTMKDISWAAYHQPPDGLEPGLEAVHYYDPPNFTFPFGIYLAVVDIDRATGETKVRRFYALDDCGTRINPMIIEGQIHGGLTEGYAVAMGQLLSFDTQGNIQGNSLMDYFLPTAVETPHWETDFTVTPSPHHPIGAKGVAESPHVGSIPTFTSAVVDAFAHTGVTHIDMPHTSYRIWKELKKHGLNLN
ncbi:MULTISPECIES: aerobic carbon-monoxide dehydrogenase large subunit [Polynucleobacter]|jgi:carbon-monoxide dehydrogenase large subunit|uniref:aerobic carbon-monoxide dehydrogenase large subunit n=1 Tax=Polynucleobacter TaxID=44013 RepID=UPI00092A863E|nr:MULTISPECIES: aerobic carbon-monoxide dehydrogenase large subunit [Polynucleobacter]MDH6155846.1 carbon-monoxide dehydrogenase large subunit [Polynucleobacter sphagniphilus]MDH6249850.1 carbon-monoxide dehydrogenase large subunit [Polynucleobacter sphagniphilus]OJI04532.1 carbon-monoxide dehydrogenase large subunit [Polynucleobacter sp. MWH-Adler-W8]